MPISLPIARVVTYASSMRRVLAAFILILLPLPALAVNYPARIVGVTDGDTLTVLRGGHDRVKIRLAEVDAPETGQPFGTQAKRAASDLVFGRDVTIREVDHDRYGRTARWSPTGRDWMRRPGEGF